MPDPAQSTPSSERFESQPEIGSVELDRYCDSCGYNLLRQPVRRETHTKLMLVRCPECGEYAPANTLTTAHRAWFRGLAVLGWCVWAATWAGFIFSATLVLAALPVEMARERMNWDKTATPVIISGRQSYIQEVTLSPMNTETWLFTGFFVLCLILSAIVLTTATTAFMPHWKRWMYIAFSAAWPLIAAALAFVFYIPERSRWSYMSNYVVDPDLLAWFYRFQVTCVVVTMVTGIGFAWLGRPLARTLTRMFVPPSKRGVFAYLWLVDGKQLTS